MRNTTARLLCVLLLSVSLLGIAASAASAQTPAVPSDKLAFDVKQDTASLTFAILVDSQRQTLSGVTCTAPNNGTSVCQAALPAMTPGTHTLQVIGILTAGGVTAESSPSVPLSVSYLAVVTPENVRLIKG